MCCPSHVLCQSSPPQKARLLRALAPAAWARPGWAPICPRVTTTRPITATISWRTTRPLLPRWPTSSSITTLSSSPAARPPPPPPPRRPHLPPLDSASRGWSGASRLCWTTTCTFTPSAARTWSSVPTARQPASTFWTAVGLWCSATGRCTWVRLCTWRSATWACPTSGRCCLV